MKMFTKSVKKVVNVSLLCSVSYGFILEDFFDKLIIWDTFILRESSILGTPLVIPWKMCHNFYSRDTILCQRCALRRGHLP